LFSGGNWDRNLVEPFGGLELGRDDRSLVVVPSVDDGEQYLGVLHGDGKQKSFVNDQEVVLDKLFSQAIKGFHPLASGHFQLVQQLGQLNIACFQQMSAGGLSESLSQERLSGSGRSHDHDVACVRDVVTRGEFQNEVAVELPVVVVPDVFDAGGRVFEPCPVDQALQPSVLPLAKLAVYQQREAVVEAHLPVAFVVPLLPERLGDPRQFHVRELVRGFMLKHGRRLRNIPLRAGIHALVVSSRLLRMSRPGECPCSSQECS